MKKIEAIIQPHKLDAVKDALTEMDVNFVTVTQVRGFGRQKGKTVIFQGSEYSSEFIPKLKLEMVIEDSQVRQASSAILQNARTGRIGDGKIFILPVTHFVRIHTAPIPAREVEHAV